MHKWGVILLVSALTTGCASQMQVADQDAKFKQLNTPLKTKVAVPFDEKQAEAALQLGSTTIKGVLYHKITGGSKHNGFEPVDAPLTLTPAKQISGVEMRLYPVTNHLLELVKLEDENRRSNRSRRFSKDKQLREYIADPNMYKYSLASKTDEHGRYSFKPLKPGRYYVVATTQDVTTYGTGLVEVGVSEWGSGSATHYRNQDYTLRTPIDYAEFVEVKPDQKEIVLESRMRVTKD
ncbi:MAG: hypothetical protein WBP13_10320 [Methylophilaceae bacterium]